MFICHTCLKKDKIKMTKGEKEWALMIIEMRRGSLGPCEVCRKKGVCADA